MNKLLLGTSIKPFHRLEDISQKYLVYDILSIYTPTYVPVYERDEKQSVEEFYFIAKIQDSFGVIFFYP